MSTMATDVKVTTFTQRANALLAAEDLTTPAGKELLSERVQGMFHGQYPRGTEPGSLYARITGDPQYSEYLNARQKAFLLAEIDLRDCPVRPGDTIEMLVHRPNSASLIQGELRVVRTFGTGSYVTTEDGWAIDHTNYRLVPSLEFPGMPGGFTGDYERVKSMAMARVEAFVRHTNEMGDWGSCDCDVVMGGVDRAAIYFSNYGLDREWAQTQEGKAWLGQVVRWMRAMVVERYLAANPEQQAAAQQEHISPEPIPERDLPAPVVTQPTLSSLAARITELEEALQALQVRNDALERSDRELRQWQTSAMRDFETANEILNQQARDRDWCSEYEMVLERINSRTSVLQWEPRSREVEVEVRGTVTIPFSVTVTVEVSGDDDADELATERVENDYTARELARNHYSDDGEMEIDECEVQ